MAGPDLLDLAEQLRELHRSGDPLILPNAWDVSSARAVVDAGFPAIATSSAAVARALGHEDHEAMPVDEAFAAVARIAGAVEVPVTADIESGYGLSPAEIVDRLLDAGAVGCNLEDTDHATGELRDAGENAARLAAFRAAADARGVPIVLNARVDCFVRDPSRLEMLDQAIERARTYLEAGADCTYPIVLGDRGAIATYVKATGGPVNALLRAGAPTIAELAAAGVHRISAGSGLHRAAFGHVRSLADALRDGDSGPLFSDA